MSSWGHRASAPLIDMPWGRLTSLNRTCLWMSMSTTPFPPWKKSFSMTTALPPNSNQSDVLHRAQNAHALCVCVFITARHFHTNHLWPSYKMSGCDCMCAFSVRVHSVYVCIHCMCAFIICVHSLYMCIHYMCTFIVYVHSLYVYIHCMCAFIVFTGAVTSSGHHGQTFYMMAIGA